MRLSVRAKGTLGNPKGGTRMTCPECHAMNSKFLGFADSGNLRIVQFKCEICGCIYSVKTQTEIKVVKHGEDKKNQPNIKAPTSMRSPAVIDEYKTKVTM
jgi:hypothetical protein